MGSLWLLFSLIIFDFSVYTSLWLIINPLTNEEFVFVMIIVTSLTFSLVIDPMAFKVISVSLGEHSVPVPFAFIPLSFVNILVGVNHPTLSLWHAVHPVAIVPVLVLEEESAPAVFLVFEPVASVFPAELATFVPPIGALSVPPVAHPHALVLVAILVVLDAEAFLAVVPPVANVARGTLPLLALDAAVFLAWLLFDPVNAPVSAILLGLGVCDFPELVEGLLGLYTLSHVDLLAVVTLCKQTGSARQ